MELCVLCRSYHSSRVTCWDVPERPTATLNGEDFERAMKAQGWKLTWLPVKAARRFEEENRP